MSRDAVESRVGNIEFLERNSRAKNSSPTNDTAYLAQRICRSAIACLSLSNANVYRVNKLCRYSMVGRYDFHRRMK